jgi:DNA uptake protein ComE-like DNA-binding protein
MRSTILVAVPFLALMACKDRTHGADTSAGADTSVAIGATTRTATGGDVQRSAGLLDPNTVTREQLASVAGVDSVTVTTIIAGRPYADMTALDKALAKNLNAEQRKALYARVWKPIDLNTAKGEEILLIPGVGPRMRHEFEEYRPYKSIEQFRREIGKYVDKNEVARLEQYVVVK